MLCSAEFLFGVLRPIKLGIFRGSMLCKYSSKENRVVSREDGFQAAFPEVLEKLRRCIDRL